MRNRDDAGPSTRTANTLVRAMGAAAGVGPSNDGRSKGPHVLRHTFDTDSPRTRKPTWGPAGRAALERVLREPLPRFHE